MKDNLACNSRQANEVAWIFKFSSFNIVMENYLVVEASYDDLVIIA